MVEYYDSGTAYANTGTSVQFTLPSSLPDGHGLLVCAGLSGIALGDLTISGGDPGGTWEPVGPGAVNDTSLRTRVWSRVAVEGDAGATVTISWTGTGKCSAAWWAGSDVHPDEMVADWATLVEAGTDTTHDAPGVTPALGRCYLVEFVVDRGTAATSIAAPDGRVTRVTQLGTGMGTTDMICADSGGPVLAGVPTGPSVYTFDSPQANAVGWSILVAPVPVRRRVELALGVDPSADPADWDGSWVDITEQVLKRDAISISGGRPDRSGTAGPTRVTLTAKNRGGRWVRTNPLSPYYGRLRKNTPMRVWVETEDGWSLRSTTFIAEFAPRRHKSGGGPSMQFISNGIMARLNQGRVLRSVLARALTSPAAASPAVAYWPCEDGEGSTSLASALPSGRPMSILGSPQLASSDVFVCSAALPVVGTSTWTGAVAPYPATGKSQVRFLVSIPAGGLTNNAVVARVNYSGTCARWDVVYTTATGGSIDFRPYDGDGVLLLPPGSANSGMNGTLQRVSIELEQNGANLDYQCFTARVDVFGAFGPVGTLATKTVGIPTSVVINPTANLGDAAMGHIAAHADISSILDMEDELAAYLGETAATRVARLGAEEGIPVSIVGDPDESEPMGPQTPSTFMDLLRECETADGGMLYEAREGRLTYQTRTARYNAPVSLVLDHAAGDVAPTLEPADDDQGTINDVEVTREGGSSARAIDQASIDEVGHYPDPVTINVVDDEQLPDHASWRLHLGTVDALRYPQISPRVHGRPAVEAAWAAVQIGERLNMTNPPPDLPPGVIDVFVEGYTERIDPLRWEATANASPAAPWNVAVLDDAALGRAGTSGSELAAGIDADDTALSVATTAGPLWTTDPADFPMDVLVGGMAMAVTAVAGASSPQTFTVVRADLSIPHAAGAEVRTAQPMTLAL